MAITPIALTRTWYSYANVAYTPADAADTQKWWLWMLKELLVGNYTGKGGTVGPEGARPASSFWTVVESSDGAGNVAASDLWVTKDNVILGNYASNHSWIVLKSPVTGPNGALGFGQGPMFMMMASSSTSGKVARNGDAIIRFSREAFTGGTATAWPTSTKEFEVPWHKNAAATVKGTQIWTNTTYGVARRASISVDANGQWYFITATSGTNTMESVSCCIENINSDDRDLYRQWCSICHFGHSFAVGARNWAGTAARATSETYANTQSASPMTFVSSGGLVNWNFGNIGIAAISGSYPTSTPINGWVGVGFIETTTGTGVGQSGYNRPMFGGANNVDIDGYVPALPLYVMDYGSGYANGTTINVTNNRTQWRGQIPDAWAIPSAAGGLSIGSSYPSAAAQTHVVVPNRIIYGCYFLVPMSVQLNLA